MKYLGLALYAEGPTDYEFLSPLLLRVCEDLALRSSQPVELSEVLGLNHPAGTDDMPRAERILRAAQAAAGQWTVLFVHADGAGDADTKRREQVDPALDALLADTSSTGRGCAVIPVRETEAWALADPTAFRPPAVGDGASPSIVPSSAKLVEKVEDPKKALRQAVLERHRVSGRRRRKAAGPALADLGRKVSLVRLREVPSWKGFEAELIDVLHDLRILP